MFCLGVKCWPPAHGVHVGDGVLTGRIQNIFRPLSNLSLFSSIFHSLLLLCLLTLYQRHLGFHGADQLSSSTYRADRVSSKLMISLPFSSNGPCVYFVVLKLLNISPFSNTDTPTCSPVCCARQLPFCFAFSHYSPLLCSALHHREVTPANGVSMPTGFHLGSASGRLMGWILERRKKREGRIFLSSLSALGNISRSGYIFPSCPICPDPKQPLFTWFQLLPHSPGSWAPGVITSSLVFLVLVLIVTPNVANLSVFLNMFLHLHKQFPMVSSLY